VGGTEKMSANGFEMSLLIVKVSISLYFLKNINKNCSTTYSVFLFFMLLLAKTSSTENFVEAKKRNSLKTPLDYGKMFFSEQI
jgi:hypothetical protein